MKSVEKMGLLKMDFLGLITLDDPRATRRGRSQERTGREARPRRHPAGRRADAYELFSEGRTDGVFQFESSGMRDLLRRAKPRVFADLAALNALYRPGRARRRHGRGLHRAAAAGRRSTYPLPELEPILQETLRRPRLPGAGHARSRRPSRATRSAEADLLRKAIGKKKREIMKAEGEKFVDEAGRARHPEEEGRRSSGR